MLEITNRVNFRLLMILSRAQAGCHRLSKRIVSRPLQTVPLTVYGGHRRCDKELQSVEFPLQLLLVRASHSGFAFFAFSFVTERVVTNSFRDEPGLQELVRYAFGTRPGV